MAPYRAGVELRKMPSSFCHCLREVLLRVRRFVMRFVMEQRRCCGSWMVIREVSTSHPKMRLTVAKVVSPWASFLGDMSGLLGVSGGSVKTASKAWSNRCMVGSC